MNESSSLLTVEEFALALRLKPSAIRRWLREGKVTAIKIGRLIRIPATEIDRIIAKGTRPAREAQ